jgi:hypothetical protein
MAELLGTKMGAVMGANGYIFAMDLPVAHMWCQDYTGNF